MKRTIIVGLIIFLAAGAASAWYLTRSTKETASPMSSTPVSKTYIALGDSVAAGVGLPTSGDIISCGQAFEGYPYLVAKQLDLELTNLSCSGATLPVGILGQQTAGGATQPAQLNTALSKSAAPSLMTLTIGANDVDWTDILTSCYTGSGCSTPANAATIKAKRDTVKSNLTTALDRMKRQYANEKPTVFITGYYNFFDAGASCSGLGGITANDVTWLREQTSLLNDTIKSVVTSYDEFATYVPIDFTGHDLCSTDSWVQDTTSSNAPFHPTSEGQAAIADAIVKVYKKK